MQTLLERGLVEQVGRAEVVGRPMTYGTTALFLEYFGLRSLEDLPAADELRRIVVQKPEALVTADPGLATVPPEQLALADRGAEAEGRPARNAEAAGRPPAEPPANEHAEQSDAHPATASAGYEHSRTSQGHRQARRADRQAAERADQARAGHRRDQAQGRRGDLRAAPRTGRAAAHLPAEPGADHQRVAAAPFTAKSCPARCRWRSR